MGEVQGPVLTVTRAAYQFAAAHQALSSVLMGTGSAEQLRANVADLVGPPLSGAQLAYPRATFGALAWNARVGPLHTYQES